MNLKSILDKSLLTTTRIESTINRKQKIGTGFIYEMLYQKKPHIFLVTCRHIVENSSNGVMKFHVIEDPQILSDSHYKIEIEDFSAKWFFHPNKNIDLAIMDIKWIIQRARYEGYNLYIRRIINENISTKIKLDENISAVEEIYFIGYPVGLYDDNTLLPIARKGITATPIFIDFKSKPIFLIDSVITEGSSGSPVFIQNLTLNLDPETRNIGLFFLGILSSEYGYNENGKPKCESKSTNLGIVLKAKLINELIQLYFNMK